MGNLQRQHTTKTICIDLSLDPCDHPSMTELVMLYGRARSLQHLLTLTFILWLAS